MPDFDINNLKKSLNLSDEEQKAFDSMFATPERVKEMQRGWNTVSEGSRLAQEAQAAKAEAERVRLAAEEKDRNATTYFQELKKYETESEQAKANAAAYEAYLKSIDVAPEVARAVANGGQPQPPKQPTAPTIDPRFMDDQKQFRDQVTATATLLADIPFELQAISNRHFELYGKVPPPDVMRGLKEKFLNPQNKQTLVDIASVEFHFAEREKELASAELDKEVERRFNEKLAAYESANKLPGGSLMQASEITPQIVDMQSKEFSENVKQAGPAAESQMTEAEHQAFIAETNALAERGVRYTYG